MLVGLFYIHLQVIQTTARVNSRKAARFATDSLFGSRSDDRCRVSGRRFRTVRDVLRWRSLGFSSSTASLHCRVVSVKTNNLIFLRISANF